VLGAVLVTKEGRVDGAQSDAQEEIFDLLGGNTPFWAEQEEAGAALEQV